MLNIRASGARKDFGPSYKIRKAKEEAFEPDQKKSI